MSTFDKEKEVMGRGLVKHREWTVSLNCLSTGQMWVWHFCCFLQGSLLPSQWNFVQWCPVLWVSLWQVVCSLRIQLCTKQKAPVGGEIQMGVRNRNARAFCVCRDTGNLFWNIWHEMSRISMSDDADGVCSVPNCRQQTVEKTSGTTLKVVKSFHEYWKLCHVPYSLWMA